MALGELFSNYPPAEGGFGTELDGKHSGTAGKTREKKDDIFSKPFRKKEEIAKKVESFASRIEKDVKLKQVVLISGETGCGKTTQVPQFLLDHNWGKGEACKIVCTQPRRISAISEFLMKEEKVLEIALDTRWEALVNCVLYKWGSVEDAGFQGISGSQNEAKAAAKENISDLTHIIVDEIHERDRFSDFMLAIIRDILPSHSHLRLILMSATLDAERFSQYFGGCPIIRVPGFTYPVKAFHLDDVLSILNSRDDNHLDFAMPNVRDEGHELTEDTALDEAINLAWSNDEFDSLLDLVSSEGTPKVYNYQHSTSGLTPLMVFAGKGRVGDVCMLLSLGANCNLQEKCGLTALKWAERENQEEAAEVIRKHAQNALADSSEQQQLLDKYMATINPEFVDVVLIEKLLKKICVDSKDGAILVFLPGWDDINKTRERLLVNPFFKDGSKFIIISLHSMVPSMEQKKVFKRPPQGCRKIILSTNISESAITIDDVVYVIDSGRMKEKSYDPYNNVSTLQSSWVSKASAKQREGRAGRCQPGICYHLYSKLRETSLPDFQVPEIKRMPIEELCLQIEDFLQKTLDPPVPETISNAVAVLVDIGALSVDETLTDLGEKIGCLPVHPLTSKMIFFAILMNCLDPALTLACASDYRDPFTLPMLPNEKKRAAAAKFELASLYGGHSDQLAVMAAFECWKKAKNRGQEASFCSQYFISSSTMNMLEAMRKQLQRELILPENVSSCNTNAHVPGIVHAVLVAGLYPMVGRFLPPKHGKRVVETTSGAKVRLHPQSLNFKLSFWKSNDYPLVIYDEITRGDGGMHIRNCTVIGPLPLLLLATEIVVAPAENDADDEDDDYDSADGAESDEDGMEIDGKLGTQQGERIMSSPDNLVMVTHPHKELPPALGAYAYTTACILSSDGLSGISLPGESVESLTSMVHATEIDRSTSGRRGTGQNPNSFLSLLMNDKQQTAPRYHNARNPNQRPPLQGLSWAQFWHARAIRSEGDYSKRQRGNTTKQHVH
uniref:RNA helicase n=1 Tax=Salix viminalis TaxID=40686 RepID=A0A6N2MMI2_SALVM